MGLNVTFYYIDQKKNEKLLYIFAGRKFFEDESKAKSQYSYLPKKVLNYFSPDQLWLSIILL